jgi:hypothetical protein
MIFDKIWRLERRMKRLQNKYPRARAQGPEAEAKASDLLEATLEEIGWLKDIRVKDQADKLEIPTNQALKEGRCRLWLPGLSVLSLEERDKLRELIRKEKRARMEDRMLWVSHVVIPVTGLVGALIGLLAFLRSCTR